MEVYRERRFRRMRRQAVTVSHAVRAGRARVRATAANATVDGEALRHLVAEAIGRLAELLGVGHKFEGYGRGAWLFTPDERRRRL